MNKEIEEELDNIANDFLNSNNIKEMLKLRDFIELNYRNQILDFSELKDEYEKALKYKKYYPDFDKLEEKYRKSKETLFSIKEVKEYKKLERTCENDLYKLSNEIGKLISNKFKEKLIFE